MSEQHEQNQVGDSWLNTAVIKLDIIEEGPGETSTCLVTILTPPPSSVIPVLQMEQEQMSQDSGSASPVPLDMDRLAVMMSQMIGKMKVMGEGFRHDICEGQV